MSYIGINYSNHTNILEMNTIGTIAGALFVLLGVSMLAPLFLVRALRETYREQGFWAFMTELPLWLTYFLLAFCTLVFWAAIGYILFG